MTFRPLPRLPLQLVALLVLAGCTALKPAGDADGSPPVQPEAATGYANKAGWTGQRLAVATAHPLASEAGLQMLRAGGNAIDAAVAAQMVLALVEPQSSGIGGGAFLLHFDGRDVRAYDGRETAPAQADAALFLRPDGTPMAFFDAVVGGRAVGVPGAVKMLEMAHAQHGKLPWPRLFEPAIRLAEQGFEVGPRLHALIAQDRHLKSDPATAAYFFDPQGQPWPVGHRLRNPALAAVLHALADGGAAALHEGSIADALVQAVRGHPVNPGRLSHEDLQTYRPLQREALCHDFTARETPYRICGFPPPGSGAIAIGQILGLLEQTGAHKLPLAQGLPSTDWLHRYAEASRLAFADRARYVADPDFVAPPGGSWHSLLDPAYLAERARLIGPRAMPSAPAGQPPGSPVAQWGRMPDQPESGTSHISIVDAQGHAVAMTSTIENAFGARLMVQGFLLNNQLTDFSFSPTDGDGQPVANRVEGGKRPRSSMSPTLVFHRDSGELVATLGSPGGALIIHYTAKTLYAMLQWGLTPQQAIALPNFGTTGGPLLLEQDRFPTSTVDALRALGHTTRSMALTSGLQALRRHAGGYLGGADPRREGVVMGD